MTNEEVIDRFRKTGALLEGHFQLSSGLHSTVYLQCAIALQSTRDTIDALRAGGGEVIAAASIIDRSGDKADVGVPRFSLATLEVAAVSADECDACQRGEPIAKPGSRKSYSSV